jgi:tRNA-specific 2-thiouridylase
MKRKVFIGFSGGIDSSVSAYLLKQKYDVTAVMFRNISNPTCNKPLEQNAKKVAKHLNIPLKIIDFTDEFKDLVIEPFIDSYKEGKTPNPCVTCNIQFKFGKFANWCFENGADLIATGHYCITKNGHLYKGQDKTKDQSYFLNGISSKILKKTLFPVGALKKEDVRQTAVEQNLPNSSRHDSQEVCFINSSLEHYLKKHIDFKKGKIVDIDTQEVLGQHNGLHSFTLGQRRGIKIGGSNKPYFVARKDTKTNSIYVAKGKLNPALWKDLFELEDFNVIHPENVGIKENLSGMVRYRSADIGCSFDWDSNIVRFKEKVWTPSVGQSLVIYKDEECIGGGVIKDIRQ